MSDNHGNTPAAWTAVVVALAGFVVGGIGLIAGSMTMFWVGVALVPVGVIANGAGLAMSTVDIVNQVGGKPANFLDIGGGANADVMAGALEVINSDDKVASIFINIFGGITRGEEVAKGIVEAMGRVDLRAPIVIRLDGTNADEGRQILLDAGISADKLQSEPTMLDAARAAVAKAK